MAVSKHWFFPLLGYLGALGATVNHPIECSLLTGYRNDRLHWHVQDGGTGLLNYSERYKNQQFWENGLAFQGIHRDLAFFARGSYAAFGRGSLLQRYAALADGAGPLDFRFDTGGWAADVDGYFGYAVNLTPDRTYTVIILPLVGYSAHFERSWIRHGHIETIPLLNGSFSSFPPGGYRTCFYGFFVGANWQIAPGGGLLFSGGYHYHWLNARFRAFFADRNGIAMPQTDTAYPVRANGNGNIGQTGWIQGEYWIDSHWKAGIGAQVHYFSSRLLDAQVAAHSGTEKIPFSQKLKVRWTPISGYIIVSREL